MKSLLYILFLFPCFLNAQVYTAGDIFSGYTDISDTVINYYYISDESYYFDLDNDSQNDVRLRAYAYNSMAGRTSYIDVIPLNSNCFVRFGRIDSVYNPATNLWLTTKVAKPLSYGDSINSLSADWKNEGLSLVNNSGNVNTYVNPTDWIGSSNLYIGIKRQTATDTIYGWIRVNCPDNKHCLLMDYSSTGFTTAIKESKNTSWSMKLYPNPTSGLLYIYYDSIIVENPRIEIINMMGELVIESPYSDVINTSRLPSGTYMVKLSAKSSGPFYSKFIKE